MQFDLEDGMQLLCEAELDVYRRESEPITDENQAQPFEKLRADFEESQTRIVGALETVSSTLFEQSQENKHIDAVCFDNGDIA